MKKLFWVFALSIITVPVFSQQKEAAEKLVSEGVALHDKGEYDKALAKYEKALSLDKDNVLALAEKALTLHAAQRNEEAIETARRAIETNPESESLKTIYATLGNSLDDLKKSQEAIEAYNEGIKKFPNYHQLYFEKGVALSRMKDYDEALLSFNKAVMLNPKHAGSHNAIARILYSKNKKVPALLALSRFFVLEPEGNRAKSNVELLQKIMQGDAEQTGKKSVTISINSDMLGDTLPNGKPTENSFKSTELILALGAALNFDKKSAKLNEAEKFRNAFKTVCASLKETQKDNYGFYWDYYVPYFVQMYDNDLLEPFAYLAFASSDDASVAKWVKANDDKLRNFYAWSSKYKWHKE